MDFLRLRFLLFLLFFFHKHNFYNFMKKNWKMPTFSSSLVKPLMNTYPHSGLYLPLSGLESRGF